MDEVASVIAAGQDVVLRQDLLGEPSDRLVADDSQTPYSVTLP
jgi:hypothetical protein